MYASQTIQLSGTVLSIEPEDFYDVLIIGGGPHALGVAARLREPRPAALYTDIEHSRLSFLQRPGSIKLPRQPKKPFQLRAPSSVVRDGQARKTFDESYPKMLALDASSPNWLGRWDGFFDHLDIPHLRSPMFFHPSPADVDGLEGFARKMEREWECVSSGGVEEVLPTVGQSQRGGDKVRNRATRKKTCAGPKGRTSKSLLGAPINERERSSYVRPSTSIFRDFCHEELVQRYNLDSVIRQATVKNVSFGDLHIKTEGRGRGFAVTTEDGKTYGAKFVVMSIGGQECPAIPQCISQYRTAEGLDTEAIVHQGPGWCHSRCFSYGGTKGFKEAVKLSQTQGNGSIVVIGGGLTSAQIADLSIRKGASKVYLISRGYLKTKHYDFPLSWVTKYSNLEKMSFWQEDCRLARLKMIKQARNGGSVNPSTLSLLKRRVAEGTLSLRTHTTVTHASRDSATGRWSLHLTHRPPKKALEEGFESPPEVLENVLFIVAATGGKLDFTTVPFLSTLFRPYPQQENNLGDLNSTPSNMQSVRVPGVVEGLPLLTEDLQWGSELPLFVMGAYAALELGPDAANLSGSRSGAERIVSKLNELLENEWFSEGIPTVLHQNEATAKSDPSDNPPELPTAQPKAEESHRLSRQSGKLESSAVIRRCAPKMGARERRAGNIGGWFAGLEEVEI